MRSICLATRWPPAGTEKLQMAWEALEKARAIGAKTPRERDWIEALSAYYRDHERCRLMTRLLAYTKAMEQVTQRYPDDFEAWVFYALTLQASAPKADKTYANQLKSAAILERLLQQQPQHPGVAHFLIHAYDYPPLAEKGLPAARRYAGLAPAASHARHMPSHIYSMVGLWEDSVASNRFALQVQPDYYHASDFMVYAHLQLGQDAKAKAMMEQAEGRRKHRKGRAGTFVNFTALAAMPARYVLERADWSGAAALPIACDAVSHGRLPDTLRARSWHGAQRQSRRSKAGGPGAAGVAHRPGASEAVLLGRSYRRAEAGRLRLDSPGGGGAGASGTAHACGC